MQLRLVIKNTLFQIVARIVSSGIGLLITILIARSFGVLGYGDFTKITVFIGLFYILLDFGLNPIFLKEDQEKIHFKDLFYLRLLFALLLIIVVNLISFFLPFNEQLNLGFSPSVKIGIMIFSLSLLTQAILISSAAIFQRKLRFDFLMIANIFGSLFTLLLIIYFIFHSLSLNYVLIAFVLGGLLTAVISLFLTREKIVKISLNKIFIKRLLLQSLPLALTLFFNLVYFRIDIFLLSVFKPTLDVGVYGFAYKFFDFLIALPLFLSNSIYPLLLNSQKNHKEFFSLSKKYFFLFFLISLVVTIISFALSPILVFIKSDFALSVVPLRILIVSLPFFFLTSILQWILISQGRQKFLMVVYLVSAVLNLCLNLIFIPIASYMASAIITGVSEAFVFIVLLIAVIRLRKYLQKQTII
ncbi:MAG: oligosaccharide flippase family protein [bacterium]|nr:oligosaccharide flippase family protein [bacterium]